MGAMVSLSAVFLREHGYIRRVLPPGRLNRRTLCETPRRETCDARTWAMRPSQFPHLPPASGGSTGAPPTRRSANRNASGRRNREGGGSPCLTIPTQCPSRPATSFLYDSQGALRAGSRRGRGVFGLALKGLHDGLQHEALGRSGAQLARDAGHPLRPVRRYLLQFLPHPGTHGYRHLLPIGVQRELRPTILDLARSRWHLLNFQYHLDLRRRRQRVHFLSCVRPGRTSSGPRRGRLRSSPPALYRGPFFVIVRFARLSGRQKTRLWAVPDGRRAAGSRFCLAR